MDDAGTTVALQLTIPWWGWVGIAATLIGVGIWVGAVQSNQTAFKDFMEEIRKDIKTLQADIKDLLKRSQPPPTVQASSPVTLTDFGRTISDALDATAWAKEHAHMLVEGAKDKEEFEVFEMCAEYVAKWFDDPENKEFSRKVREATYQHGTDLHNVLKVYHVVLRDEVFELMKSS
ncbi:MAG: hypothetical protein F4X97_06310 [Boseongicola sp. SB0662_bin_57]|nr:hypothetical protein [Boseongicola sp. SB0662_bin_57]